MVIGFQVVSGNIKKRVTQTALEYQLTGINFKIVCGIKSDKIRRVVFSKGFEMHLE